MEASPQQQQPATGMFAPYEPPVIGEPLETLEEAGAFVLVSVAVREGVNTQFGLRDAVDMVVATTDRNVTRAFSGFAAGIVGQAKRVQDGDLPALCRIVPQPTGRGATRGLELVQKLEAGADLAAIVKAQPVPMMPIANPNEIPY